MVCLNCHKNIKDNSEICPHCNFRFKKVAKKPQSSKRKVSPPTVSSEPVRKKQSASQTKKEPTKKQAPAPTKLPVKQPPKPVAAPEKAPARKTKPKETGKFNSFMAYFILPAFIVFDVAVIFLILNSLAESEHRISGIFTVCAQTAHLICAVAASHGLKMKSFSSLIFLVLCVTVTAVQTAVSLLFFISALNKVLLIAIITAAAATVILTAVSVPYYLKRKKNFSKNDILF